MNGTDSEPDSCGFLATLLRRPAVRLVALALATIQTAGCMVTERHPLPTPVTVTDPMVVNWNDRELFLVDTRLHADSVVGSEIRLGAGMEARYYGRPEPPPDTVEVRIPVGELYLIDRRFSGGRTVLALAGLLGLVGVFGAVTFAQSGWR